MAVPFVGAARHALVDALVEHFEAVRDGVSGPHLVVLEAATGSGKSRVVQEFYHRLASTQEQPPYWPPRIEEAAHVGVRGVLQGERKLLHPQEFEVPDGASPAYFWWGIAATRRQAGLSAVRALAEDVEQFLVHEAALERRFRSVAGPGRRAGRAVRRHGRRAAAAGLGEAVSGVVAGALGLPIGPGLVVPALVTAARAVQERRRTTGTIDVGGPDRTATGELGEAVLGLARGGIPMVIAVEDVHTADEELVGFLSGLLADAKAPILVIATAWPGLLDEPSRPAARLLDAAGGALVHRYGPTDLAPLARDDVERIVADLQPDLLPDDRRLLAAHFRNPLALQLALAEPSSLVRAARAGGLAAALEGFPTDVGGVYRVMWDELPQALRRALAVAVMTSPAGVGGMLASRAWDAQLVAAAGAALPWLRESTGDLADLLDRESVAYGWVRHVDEWLQMCIEPAQHDIALETRREVVSDAERRQIYGALAAAIDLEADLPPARRSSNAQLLLALALEGFVEWSPSVFASAELVARELLERGATEDLRQAASILEGAPDLAPEDRLRRLVLLMQVEARRSHHAAALAMGEELLSALPDVAGVTAHELLAIRYFIATQRRALGDVAGARDELEAVIAAAVPELGPGDDLTLVARQALLDLHATRGQYGPALEQAQGVVRAFRDLHGKDDHRVLLARLAEARLYAAAGNVAGGLRMARRLAGDLERTIGPDASATLQARSVVAELLGASGRHDSAAQELERVVRGYEGLFGADDLRTLHARSERASLLASGLDHRRALVEHVEVLRLATERYGRSHTDVLPLARKYVKLHAEMGHLEVAIEECGRLFEEAAQDLGNRHPTTLGFRRLLTDILGQLRPDDEAVRQFEKLIEVLDDVFGPDSNETSSARSDLALLLSRMERFDAAVEQVSHVLDVRLRALGAENPTTLTTRGDLASHLVVAGRLDEARAEALTLLDLGQRVLGPRDPEMIQTRLLLAEIESLEGRRMAAAESFLAVVRDAEDSLGPDHLDVLYSRMELAHLLEDLGRDDDAMEHFLRLAESRIRMFGWRNPRVAMEVMHLAHLVGGRTTDRAAEVGAQLLADCIREYGARSDVTHHVEAALSGPGCDHGTWGTRRVGVDGGASASGAGSH